MNIRYQQVKYTHAHTD